jgi:hypothetical protein
MNERKDQKKRVFQSSLLVFFVFFSNLYVFKTKQKNQVKTKQLLCDGIREPVSGSLLYGNNIISGAIIPTSNAIGLHS